MKTIELTAENFEAVVAKQGTMVLVDFWAAWCAPCRAFAPIFEAAADRHPNVVFAKVDTEAQPELAAAFQIRAIPTLMAFRDGILLLDQAGMLPAAALDEVVEKMSELDMADVRTKLETAKAEAAKNDNARKNAVNE